jgi:predicted regulator of amino acid metabolism with ACT domain
MNTRYLVVCIYNYFNKKTDKRTVRLFIIRTLGYTYEERKSEDKLVLIAKIREMLGVDRSSSNQTLEQVERNDYMYMKCCLCWRFV